MAKVRLKEEQITYNTKQQTLEWPSQKIQGQDEGCYLCKHEDTLTW